MKKQLLSFAMSVLFVPNLFAGEVELSSIKPPEKEDLHSEAPIDVNVDDKKLTIFSYHYIDRMTVVAQGDGDSSVLEIDSAVPGEVYEMDLRQSSHGHYDLYIYTSTGEILNGEFEL